MEALFADCPSWTSRSRSSERCSLAHHDALKTNDIEWSKLVKLGTQEDYDDAGNRADLELANCPCGSTLARKAR